MNSPAMKKIFAFVFFICFLNLGKAQFQRLIVNEFSQGTANGEFIELLVVGNKTCTDSTVDLRGWIVDDNNSWHGSEGIAAGHLRFSLNTNWSKVPFGSIILLYNGDDKNDRIKIADDPTDSNKDKVYVVKVLADNNNTRTYIEGDTEANAVPPASANSFASYSTSVSYGKAILGWTNVGLKNGNSDAVIIVDPSSTSTRNKPHFSISYGNARGKLTPTIQVDAVDGQQNCFLIDSLYTRQASWTIGDASTSNSANEETPGAPNTPANKAWIDRMRTVSLGGAAPTINISNSPIQACFSNALQNAALNFTTTNGPTTYSINWNSSPANTLTPATDVSLSGSSINIGIPANLAANTYTGTIEVKNSCATGVGVPFSLVINSAPVRPTLQEITPNTCVTTSGIVVTAPTTGVQYSIDGTNFTNTSTFLGLTPLTTYTVTIKNSTTGCTSNNTITLASLPTAPTNPVLSITQAPTCSITTGTITTVPQTGVTYSIKNEDGTGFKIDNQTSNVFANLIPGKYTVTVTNSIGCIAQTSISVPSAPGAPITPSTTSPINLCQNTTATALQATGTAGSTLQWYIDLSAAPTTTAPIPPTNTPAIFTYYVSQKDNTTNCESAKVPIAITIISTPVLPTVTNTISYCQNATSVALTASGSNGTALLNWYNVATGGISSNIAFKPTTTKIGDSLFYVSQTIDGCEGPRASIKVTVAAAPQAPTTTTPVLYCKNAIATALSATGTNLRWYTSNIGSSVGSATAPTPTTSSIGNTQFFVSQTDNGCESPKTTIVVTVNDIPNTPTATSPINYCKNDISTALSAVGSNLLWYTSPTGVGSSSAPIPDTKNNGNTTYFVTQTANNCESAKLPIAVNIAALPAATISYPNTSFLPSAGLITATQTGTSGGAYSAAPSGLTINSTTGSFNASNSLPNTYTITYSFSNGQCSNSATAVVTIRPSNTEVYIPNTFTPNGDGQNDVFLIYGNTIVSVDLRVFNQWGEAIFESTDKTVGWNGVSKGKLQPVGVYIYAAKVTLSDGTVVNKKGSINLIR
jgi:gliding motility-associated-like protein